MEWVLMFQPTDRWLELSPEARRAGAAVGRRCRVWCATMEREVEVEFVTRGPFGLRRRVGVRSCTAFDPPTAVTCARRCLDTAYRRQWEPALPVHSS